MSLFTFSRFHFQQQLVLHTASGSEAAGGTVGAVQDAAPRAPSGSRNTDPAGHLAGLSTAVKLMRIFRWKMKALILLIINT